MILSFLAALLKKIRPAPLATAKAKRILIIRRNRMGDMICTLPLLQTLRTHFPEAHLTVACDALGEELAHASGVVDEVVVLKKGWNRWVDILRTAARWQNYAIVLAIKGGYDTRLAALVQLTNAPVRIGYVDAKHTDSPAYTARVPWLPDYNAEHQIDVQLRLLEPLGITEGKRLVTLVIAPEHRHFARQLLAQPPLAGATDFVLINLSSTARLKFRDEDFYELTQLLLKATAAVVGLVFSPRDLPRAQALAEKIASPRVVVLPTPSPLDLAALLEKAALFLTPEGGAAHLAAATGTRTLIFWSEGPFQKWHSRHARHIHLPPDHGKNRIDVDEVWKLLQENFLNSGGS